jgi:hypothetical protein
VCEGTEEQHFMSGGKTSEKGSAGKNVWAGLKEEGMKLSLCGLQEQ